MGSARTPLALLVCGALAACGTSGDISSGEDDTGISFDGAAARGVVDAADGAVGGTEPDVPTVGGQDAEPAADVGEQDVLVDAAVEDAPDDVPIGPQAGETGWPCEENIDCFSGLCLPSAAGEVCAETCDAACPEGFTCSSLQLPGADPTFVCMDRQVHLCQPCQAHSDCQLFSGEAGARCVSLGAVEGSFCGLPCESANDCPGGDGGDFVCVSILGEGQCLPASGACQCNAWGIQSAAATGCGEPPCEGSRGCTQDGLSVCSAPEPLAELCNGEDDDCDSVVDNGFLTDGQYLHPEHCGACGDSCSDSIASGTAACGVVDGLATCVVEVCDDGYEKVSAGECAPSAEGHCAPCSLDADCPDWLQCQGMGAGAFCLSTCESDGDCAEGYACTELPGTGELACLPGGGACAGPGSPCVVNGHCEDLDACTADVCGADDTCGYEAINCDDGEVCTSDSCDVALGCVSVAVDDGEACDDGEVCTVGDACAAGLCGAGDWLECDDGLFCTVDACVAVDGGGAGCENAPVEGVCVIDGGCQADGAGHPSDPCLVCDAGLDSLGWSARLDGSECSDGEYCTVGDGCLGGVCTPAGPRDCGFLDSQCAVGGCDEGAETCTPDAVDDGVGCDADGNACTVGDACGAGACEAGAALDCDDGLECTVDACEVDAGTGEPGCVHTPVAGACVIDDGCVVEGASPVDEPCRVCSTALDPWAWSDRADGTECEDGAWCTVGDTCAAGVCEAGAAADCSGLSDQCLTGTCDEEADACVATPVAEGVACDADGDGCTVGDACAGGVCLAGSQADCSDGVACTDDVCGSDDPGAFSCTHPVTEGACYIGGACYTAFQDHPDDACLGCFPADSPDIWSPQEDGLICDDGNPCSDDDACSGGVCAGVSESECAPLEVEAETESCGLCGTRQRTRECGGTCSWGVWGDWGECSSEGVCEAGSTQAEDEGCGMCGTRTRYRACSASCDWEPWSPFGGCTDEGTCSAGTTEPGTEGCGDCGTRATVRTCGDSCEWGPFEANGSCQSEGICSPNDTQSSSEPCGLCGTQGLQRTCNAQCGWSGWQQVGACSDQGVCTPGQTQDDTQTCGNCGSQARTRTCGGSCQWEAWPSWSGCSGSGECSAGQSESQSCGNCGTQSRTCSGGCDWGGWSGCSDPCPDSHTVWRFYWGAGDNADHMFSLTNNPPSPYWTEGAGFKLYDTPGPGLVALYQSYNAASVDHLQGKSATEGQPSYCCHSSLGYCSTSQTAHANKPLYRLYNPNNSDHFVTTNAGEAGGGYVNEAVVCYVP